MQNIKILPKKFLIGPLLGETTQNEKNLELGQKKCLLFFSFVNPLYETLPVFPKFNPITASGMALSVNLGPKCKNLFPLV